MRFRFVGLLSASACVLASSTALASMPATLEQAVDTVRLLQAMESRGELDVADTARLVGLLDSSFPGASKQARTARAASRCVTAELVQARRFAHEHGARVLRYPPQSAGFIESSTLPIRVFYDESSALPRAELILTWAEQAWNDQVLTDGFPAPFADGEEGPVIQGLWIYSAPTGMGGGGYTEWLADVPSTPNTDCSARIVIDPRNRDREIPDVVIHEFNHATQMAADCAEHISAYEGFATAVEHSYLPDSYYFLRGFLPGFQQFPQYPLDYWTQSSGSLTIPSSNYQYGQGLYGLFLRDRFGDGKISFLREVWDSFRQDGVLHVTPWSVEAEPGNTVTWFDGINTLLQSHGSSFDEAFDEFTVWRSITGPRDDGHHFKLGAEYSIVRTVWAASLDELPVNRSTTVREYGSRHVMIKPASFPGPLVVEVDADPEGIWSASVLLWREGQPVERLVMPLEGAAGSLQLDSLAGIQQAMLVVAHRGDGVHVPEEMEYDTERSFTYVLRDPNAPDAGPDAEPDAGPDAPHDSGTDDADSDDASATDAGADALEQTDAPLEQAAAPEDDGGCGCRTAPARQHGFLSAVILLSAAALGLRTRRR